MGAIDRDRELAGGPDFLDPPPNPARAAATWLGRTVDRDRVAVGLLVAAMVAYVATATFIMRGTTQFVDELSIFTDSDGFRPGALLTPLNGHLILVSRVLWAVDLQVLGGPFVLARIFVQVGVLAIAALLFVLARPRVGAPVALVPAVMSLFYGTAWENVFVPSGIPPVYAIVGGLGALVVLDRGGRRRDLAACALLVLSVCSWTAGVAFCLGAAVLVLVQGGGWRRLWVVAVPLALYAGWNVWMRISYLPDHPLAQYVDYANLLLIPNYAMEEAAQVLGSLMGLNYPFGEKEPFSEFSTSTAFGPGLLIAVIVLLVVRIRRGGVPPVLWGALVAVVAFWALLGLGYNDARSPSTARFVHVGGILVLAIATLAATGTRRIRGDALLVLYAVAALTLVTNIARLKDGAEQYRSLSITLRAELTGMDIARDVADPGYQRYTTGLQITTAGLYRDAVDRSGSPAYSLAELETKTPVLKAAADAVIIQAERIAAVAAPPGTSTGACRRVGAEETTTGVTVTTPGVVLRAATDTQIQLRRLAPVRLSPYGTPLPDAGVGPAAGGKRTLLALPADRSDRPWTLTLNPAPASALVCPLN